MLAQFVRELKTVHARQAEVEPYDFRLELLPQL